MSITIVLWDVATAMNLGLVTRTCYVLGQGHAQLAIYDPAGMTTRCRESIRRFSSYATDHFDDVQFLATEHEVRTLLGAPDGRTVVATPDGHDSMDLTSFRFAPHDRIVFGNEYRGLPADLVAAADLRVTIPMYGAPYERPDAHGRVTGIGTQRCLSLISSVSIVLYAALLQTTGFRRWKTIDHVPAERA
jgi:tRNA(Leu) C34 or U34 (ribose-2'-O)-methylase TrmL